MAQQRTPFDSGITHRPRRHLCFAAGDASIYTPAQKLIHVTIKATGRKACIAVCAPCHADLDAKRKAIPNG
jgi:hypothetical protein